MSIFPILSSPGEKKRGEKKQYEKPPRERKKQSEEKRGAITESSFSEVVRKKVEDNTGRPSLTIKKKKSSEKQQAHRREKGALYIQLSRKEKRSGQQQVKITKGGKK